MEMDYLNDYQVPMATDSGAENAVDNRSQSRFCDRPSLPFPFKKPRFSERNSNPRIPLPVDRSELSISNKSELCRLFQRGECPFGENCRYAHNMSEIGKAGFKSVDEEEHLNEARQRNDVKECRYSYSGLDCPYGEKCQYIHKCDWNVVNGRRNRSGSDQTESKNLVPCQFHPNLYLYKSKLCIKYVRYGSCPYGVQCTYAHGKSELKERGYYSKVEGDDAFKSRLDDVRPNNAAGIKTANKLQMEGKGRLINWNIEHISRIYADWVEMIH